MLVLDLWRLFNGLGRPDDGDSDIRERSTVLVARVLGHCSARDNATGTSVVESGSRSEVVSRRCRHLVCPRNTTGTHFIEPVVHNFTGTVGSFRSHSTRLACAE